MAQLEQKLKKLYSANYNEIKAKLKEQLSKMTNLDKNATVQERYIEALKYQRLEKLEQELMDAIRQANIDAVKMLNKEMVNVYQLNYNGMGDGVVPLLDKNTISGILNGDIAPFKKLSLDNMKDASMIRSKLTTQLTNGILQGESIDNIASRIRSVYESNLSSSIMIARTETTRVEGLARFKVGEQAEKLGFEVYKRWVATGDERTRDAHVKANGQEVKFNEPFIVGGEKLMYPGDENGSAENVINCRCTMVTISKLKK